MTSLLPKRSANAIRKAILRHIGFYSQRGIRISALLSDNEQGITSLGLQFGGANIVLIQAGPGTHVPQVERALRTDKEGTRGLLNTLPYDCPLVIFSHLPGYVASRMSIFKSSKDLPISLPSRSYMVDLSMRKSMATLNIDIPEAT